MKENITLCLEDGKVESLDKLTASFKKKEIMDQIEKDGYYLHDGRYIPHLTASLMSYNTRGMTLGIVMCKHCKKEIIMTIKSILKEECKWCCNCNRNIYDKNDKKVLEKRW